MARKGKKDLVGIKATKRGKLTLMRETEAEKVVDVAIKSGETPLAVLAEAAVSAGKTLQQVFCEATGLPPERRP